MKYSFKKKRIFENNISKNEIKEYKEKCCKTKLVKKIE